MVPDPRWRLGLANLFGRPHFDSSDLGSTGGSKATSSQTMLCVSCETPIPDGSKFCMNCGADLSDPSSETAQSLDEAGVAKLTRLLREATAGEYEIEREIGRGGMGVVYTAIETQLRRQVAIKVLPPSLTFGEGAIERFQREARTAAHLEHPNVIPVHRVSSGTELMWYSMKYIEGHTLETELREKGPLELDRTIEILDQVADALDYAHEHDVINRDIKPGNIMFDSRGNVIVADFGIAKELQEGYLTASGSLLGTPYYMSPEQYMGTEITGAADQYSVAVLAFQMLAGRLPFEATTPYDLLNKHVSQPPPSLEELRPGLPAHAYGAIERGLAKKRDQRFPSVKALVDALAGRTTEIAIPLEPKRLAWLKPVGIAAVVIALGGAGWIVSQGGSDPVSVAATVEEAPRPPALAAVDDSGTTVEDSSAGVQTPAAEGPEAVTTPARPAPTQAQQTPPTPEPQTATLLLILNVAARIHIDDVFIIEGAMRSEILGTGTHRIRLERDGFVTLDTLINFHVGENRINLTMERSQ